MPGKKLFIGQAKISHDLLTNTIENKLTNYKKVSVVDLIIANDLSFV